MNQGSGEYDVTLRNLDFVQLVTSQEDDRIVRYRAESQDEGAPGFLFILTATAPAPRGPEESAELQQLLSNLLVGFALIHEDQRDGSDIVLDTESNWQFDVEDKCWRPRCLHMRRQGWTFIFRQRCMGTGRGGVTVTVP